MANYDVALSEAVKDRVAVDLALEAFNSETQAQYGRVLDRVNALGHDFSVKFRRVLDALELGSITVDQLLRGEVCGHTG